MARKNVLTRSRKRKAAELVAQHRLAEARDLYQKICKADPRDGEAWFRLGVIHGELSDFVSSEVCCRKALELEPENVTALANLGGALEMQHRHDEALELFERAHAMAPNATRPIGSIANIYERLGRFQDALELIRPVVSARVLDINVGMAYARLCKHVGDPVEAAEYLAAVLAGAQATPVETTRMLFLLGILHDRMKDYSRAFEFFARANRSKGYQFDARQHRDRIDTDMQRFTRETLAQLPMASIRSDGLPVFIVGMPRSGTSLVEQIVSSHPSVAGAGELRDIGEIARSLCSQPVSGTVYSGDMDKFADSDPDKYAEVYLHTLRSFAANARRVTDKLPNNFLYLGLIQQLFPDARVIHCRRNPMDTCLSCYFQDFLGFHDYAYDLAGLGAYYRDYERLMTHWKQELDLPMYEVVYEDLVSRQEAVSRELVDFLGLEWDSGCLDFHKSERLVNTASYDQVRQPMYSGSVERWRNYESFLGPLLDALGQPATEAGMSGPIHPTE